MSRGSPVDRLYQAVICVGGYKGEDWNRFWNMEGLDGQAREFELYFAGRY